MTTIHICTHYEIVGQAFKLGPNRRKAIAAGAAKAADYLRGKGLAVALTDNFARFDSQARVHNWFALPHNELTPAISASIAEAAHLYCEVLKSWEDLTS